MTTKKVLSSPYLEKEIKIKKKSCQLLKAAGFSEPIK
jgi:hypothetical protein